MGVWALNRGRGWVGSKINKKCIYIFPNNHNLQWIPNSWVLPSHFPPSPLTYQLPKSQEGWMGGCHNYTPINLFDSLEFIVQLLIQLMNITSVTPGATQDQFNCGGYTTSNWGKSIVILIIRWPMKRHIYCIKYTIGTNTIVWQIEFMLPKNTHSSHSKL